MPDEVRQWYEFGEFRYDAGQRLLFRGRESVPLTPKVSETLRVLLERRGLIVEKAELIKAVWPDTFVDEIGLARNISALRKAIGDSPEGERFIETVPRRGYRFVGEVLDQTQAAPRRHRIWTWAISAVAAIAIAGGIYYEFYRPSPYLPTGSNFATIAVVPFEALSPDLTRVSFPAAFAELLAAGLSRLGPVHVISPATVRRYREDRIPVPLMARMLRLDAIVEGTVQQVGTRLRITARMADVHSGKLIWAGNYERAADQVMQAQDEVSAAIAKEIGSRLKSRAR